MPDPIQATRTLPLGKAAPDLAAKVSQVQRRMGLVALATGCAMAIPVALAWLALEMPLDWKFEFSKGTRFLFLLFGLGSSCAVAWWFGFRPWQRKPDEVQVALSIERALPELRTRFIASVQLSRHPEAQTQPLVKALIKDTAERAKNLAFDRVVPVVSLLKWTQIALAASVIAAGLWWMGGKASWPLLQRAFLANIPRPSNTQIVSWTGSVVTAAGDDLRLEATVGGVIPPKGTLRVQPQAGKEMEFTLDADPDDATRFLRVLQTVQQNLRYRLEIGDTRTEWANVEVRPRPIVTTLALEQHWPAYTGLPPIKKNAADLKLLAGSRLAMSLKANVSLSAAEAQLLGTDRKVLLSSPMLRSLAPSASASDWTGSVQIPAKDATGFTFELSDEAGVRSRGMAAYRLEIIPDQVPVLNILWPSRREELATANATLLIAFEAKDDFGIDRIKLHYGVNWSPGTPHRSLDLDLEQKRPKSLTRRFEWDLRRLQPSLKEGDVLDYWFEVADANNVTGPGIAVLPEHYQVRIVSEEEKRADLSARLTDTLQGLNDLRQNQDELAQRLGDLIREKKQ